MRVTSANQELVEHYLKQATSVLARVKACSFSPVLCSVSKRQVRDWLRCNQGYSWNIFWHEASKTLYVGE